MAPETSTHLTTATPRALIVGHAPIAQVVGHWLHSGGTEVDFLVPSDQLARAQSGFDIHRYGWLRYGEYTPFTAFNAFASAHDVPDRAHDQIWLALPQRQLHGVFDQLVGLKPSALFVLLDPSDRAYLEQRVDPVRVVSATLPLVAYRVPLPTETVPPGTAYWQPPGLSMHFWGECAGDIARTLRQAGVSAETSTADPELLQQFDDALRLPLHMSLHTHDWSLEKLRTSAAGRQLLIGAIEELSAVTARQTGIAAPRHVTFATEEWSWKAGLYVAPRLLPFPVEDVLQHYFAERPLAPEALSRLIRACIDNGVQPVHFGELFDKWANYRSRPRLGEESSARKVPRLAAPVVEDSEEEVAKLEVSAGDHAAKVPKLAAPIVEE